ncbi:hypothetical protein M0812_22888 [Anaeramoeba flamelloides]|uniref:B30.2/SPRY domain-containing protein n=1 Tax=Anaeramoeba flamelloides TaxID=1746091 RepID=A0AAV7YMC6_9EUKA|nr:hypothetical protein M0812_22888 [Anaeramoeba flamelloides]
MENVKTGSTNKKTLQCSICQSRIESTTTNSSSVCNKCKLVQSQGYYQNTLNFTNRGRPKKPTIKILDSNDISKLEIIETKINKSETEKELSYPRFIHRGVTFTQLGKICLFKTGSRICGNKIYGNGVNKIDFQIIDFPKKKFQWNELKIGVVESSGREQFLQQKGFLHCFYYETYWDGCEMFSWKCKNYEQEQYAKPLINGDNFSIIIDQYLHQISFSINNEKYEVAWNGIPKQVSVFLSVKSEKGNKIKYVNNKKTFF